MRRSSTETRTLIETTLADMVTTGDKVNVSTVAKRVGINHSYIHNDYPDLKRKIDIAKDKQQAEKKRISDNKLISSQKKKLSALKKQSQNEESNAVEHKQSESLLLAQMMETYRLCDDLRQENEDLKNRLMHGIGGASPETGEIIGLHNIKPRK